MIVNSSEEVRQSIYKTSTILFLMGLFGYFFNIGFNALLARHVSAALYGDFSVALRVLNLVSVYMLFGTLSSSKRFYSAYLKAKKIDTASKYMNWNLRLVLISSAIFLTMLTLLAVVIVGLHAFQIHDIRKYHLLVYFLWLAPVNAFTLLISAYLICDRDVYLGTFFDSTGFYLFGMILLMPIVYLFHISFHTVNLWFFMFGIFMVMALMQSVVLFKRVPLLLRKSFINFFNRHESDKPFEKEWWKVSKRLILNQLIYLLVRSADILLLAMIMPDKKIVGYYAAALTISGIFLITQTALFQLPSSLFSSLTATVEKKQQLQKLINKSQLMNVILNVSLLIVVMIFTGPILKLFGAQFIVAKIPLWILLGGILISIFTAPAPRLLAYCGQEKYLMYTAFVEIAVVVISGVILIYFFGMIGAAISMLFTSFARGMMSTYFVRKKLHVKAAIIF